MKPFMLNKNAKEVLCIIEEIIKKRLIRAKFEDRKIREKEKEFRKIKEELSGKKDIRNRTRKNS